MKDIAENRVIKIEDLKVGDVFLFRNNYNKKTQPVKDKYIFSTMFMDDFYANKLQPEWDEAFRNEIWDVDLTRHRARVVFKPSWNRIYIQLEHRNVKYKKRGTKTWRLGDAQDLLSINRDVIEDDYSNVGIFMPFNFVINNNRKGSLNLITRLGEHDILTDVIDVSHRIGDGDEIQPFNDNTMEVEYFNVSTNKVRIGMKGEEANVSCVKIDNKKKRGIMGQFLSTSNFIISTTPNEWEGRTHNLIFRDGRDGELKEMDIDIKPIVDAIETTIHNMVDAHQFKGVDKIERILSVKIGDSPYIGGIKLPDIDFPHESEVE